MTNLILDVDSYKTSHEWQYPPEISCVRSYIEPRGVSDEMAKAVGFDKDNIFIVNFGLQMYIKKLLANPITIEDIDEADSLCKMHGVPFNRAGWLHILNAFGGFMPVKIHALPEGALFRPGVAQVQVINTGGSKTRWVTSYIETALLRAVWYPSTVANNQLPVASYD